jgi:hypothetical protein
LVLGLEAAIARARGGIDFPMTARSRCWMYMSPLRGRRASAAGWVKAGGQDRGYIAPARAAGVASARVVSEQWPGRGRLFASRAAGGRTMITRNRYFLKLFVALAPHFAVVAAAPGVDSLRWHWRIRDVAAAVGIVPRSL